MSDILFGDTRIGPNLRSGNVLVLGTVVHKKNSILIDSTNSTTQSNLLISAGSTPKEPG